MRILFISASPIRKEISIGSTFLNLFSEIDDVELASICTRTGTPDQAVSRCFCITDKMLVRNLFGKGAAGVELDCSASASSGNTPAVESDAVRFAKKKRWSIFFWMQNALWRIGRWKNKGLREFIEDYKPDIIFTVLSEKIFLNRIICYVKKVSNAKLMVYAWDNNYSMKRLSFSPFDWIGHMANRHHMRRVVKKADKLYVISDVQKTDYEKAFRKPCTVITKFADFTDGPFVKTAYGSPLQLVYTGNLYANRWKTLAMIVRTLQTVNQGGTKAELRIYSGSLITDSMRKALHVPGASYLMGSVSSQEVLRIQSEADILVHTEATDLKNRLAVRQSFSTKIVDYLKSSRPILAVGPRSVASIKHLDEHQCAIIAESEQELLEKLTSVIDNKDELDGLVERAYVCGRQCHQKQDILSVLCDDLARLTDGERSIS